MPNADEIMLSVRVLHKLEEEQIQKRLENFPYDVRVRLLREIDKELGFVVEDTITAAISRDRHRLKMSLLNIKLLELERMRECKYE